MSTEQREHELTDHKTVRRGLLAVLGGLAGAALFKVTGAKANATGTVGGASTTAIGLIATPGTNAPITPTITNNSTHALIGSNSAVAVLSMSSGVAGARNGGGTTGVLGVNAGSG